MDPQQLIDFIRTQLIQGKSRPEIEQILRVNNVSEKAAAIAFGAAEWEKNQNHPSPARGSRRINPLLLTILLLLLLVTVAAAYVTFYQPDLLNQWLSKTPHGNN